MAILYQFECPNPDCRAAIERLCKYEEKEEQTCTLCETKLVPLLTVLSDHGINVEGRPKKWSND